MSKYNLNFDLTKCPTSSKFVIDTNILFYIHAHFYSQTEPWKVQYVNFIGRILQSELEIIISTLSVQELFHLVEKKMFELYRDSLQVTDKQINLKNYRNIRTERRNVKAILSSMLNELLACYTIQDTPCSIFDLSGFVTDFDKHNYDPIDYIISNTSKGHNIYFVTNDKDFLKDTSIHVITTQRL